MKKLILLSSIIIIIVGNIIKFEQREELEIKQEVIRYLEGKYHNGFVVKSFEEAGESGRVNLTIESEDPRTEFIVFYYKGTESMIDTYTENLRERGYQ